MLQFPLSDLRESVYATIIFFDIFDIPLTLDEIQFYCSRDAKFCVSTTIKLPQKHVVKEFLENESGIRNATLNGIVYYFLKGRSSIVHTRLQRIRISEKLWKKVRFFMPFIQMVPFIKMAAVCNTLAFYNATHDSDIDLFIIAKRGRLFIVRFFTLFLFSILGIRRHGKKIAGRFCLSFYIDEDFLNLESLQLPSGDIYLPFWMITMKPLYGERCYHTFMAKNLWLKKYFQYPLFYDGDFLRQTSLKIFGDFWEFLLKGKFGDWLEKKLYFLQQKRHQKNIALIAPNASVMVEKNILKFHNLDRRAEIQRKFEEKMRDLRL